MPINKKHMHAFFRWFMRCLLLDDQTPYFIIILEASCRFLFYSYLFCILIFLLLENF
jgi:hypothetical protein